MDCNHTWVRKERVQVIVFVECKRCGHEEIMYHKDEYIIIKKKAHTPVKQ